MSEKSLENEAISGFPVLGRVAAGPFMAGWGRPGMERMKKDPNGGGWEYTGRGREGKILDKPALISRSN